MLGQAPGSRLSQRGDGELAGAVRGEIRIALTPGDRRRQDELASGALSNHLLGRLLLADQSAEAVDVQGRPPVLLRDVEEVHRLDDARNGEEDIESTEGVHGLLHRVGHVAAFRDVAAHGDSPTALCLDLLGDRVGCVHVQVEEHDLGTLISQLQGDGAAHAAAGPGDQNPLVLHASYHDRQLLLGRVVRSATASS